MTEVLSGGQGVNARGSYLDEFLWEGMDKMGVPPLVEECIKSLEALWSKPDHDEWSIGILPVLTWMKKLQDLICNIHVYIYIYIYITYIYI